MMLTDPDLEVLLPTMVDKHSVDPEVPVPWEESLEASKISTALLPDNKTPRQRFKPPEPDILARPVEVGSEETTILTTMMMILDHQDSHLEVHSPQWIAIVNHEEGMAPQDLLMDAVMAVEALHPGEEITVAEAEVVHLEEEIVEQVYFPYLNGPDQVLMS